MEFVANILNVDILDLSHYYTNQPHGNTLCEMERTHLYHLVDTLPAGNYMDRTKDDIWQNMASETAGNNTQ